MFIVLKYIKGNTQERNLMLIASFSFFIYVLSILKLPLWSGLIGTKLGFILIDNRLATLFSGISGSLVAAYIFHFFSSVVHAAKNNHIAEIKLKDAYYSILSNICVQHLTFDQSNDYRLPSGRVEYTYDALLIAKDSIDAQQVFNGNTIINDALSADSLQIHINLAKRYAHTVLLMHARAKQLAALDVYYKSFDLETINEIECIKNILGNIPINPPYETMQAKHATIINSQRQLVKLLLERRHH